MSVEAGITITVMTNGCVPSRVGVARPRGHRAARGRADRPPAKEMGRRLRHGVGARGRIRMVRHLRYPAGGVPKNRSGLRHPFSIARSRNREDTGAGVVLQSAGKTGDQYSS